MKLFFLELHGGLVIFCCCICFFYHCFCLLLYIKVATFCIGYFNYFVNESFNSFYSFLVFKYFARVHSCQCTNRRERRIPSYKKEIVVNYAFFILQSYSFFFTIIIFASGPFQHHQLLEHQHHPFSDIQQVWLVVQQSYV